MIDDFFIVDFLYKRLGWQTLYTISYVPLNESQTATILSKTTREYEAQSAVIVQAIMKSKS